MKSYIVFVLLALLPIMIAVSGCNRPSSKPFDSDQTPPASGGGTISGSGTAPVNTDATKDWYAYEAKDGSYSIKFPARPEETPNTIQTAIGTITTVFVTYTTNGGKRSYMANSTVYAVPSSQYNVEKGLDGARDGMAKNINATVTSETKLDQKGISGREVNITTPNGGKGKAHIFIVNNGKNPVIFQAVVADTDGNIDVASTDLFLNSLNLKNP